MIYHPRSHSHGRKYRNPAAALEIAIGIVAWSLVCIISFWAILEMLKLYTTD